MKPENLFDRLRHAHTPTPEQHARVADTVRRRMRAAYALEESRASTPIADRLELWSMIATSLVREPIARHRALHWVSAFVVLVIALRASPLLFLAPSTIAGSEVFAIPTRGEVLVSLQGFWQPIAEEMELQQSVQMKTEDGEATIILHDDGNVRMRESTTLTLHDLTDRPEPGFDGPTITLSSGEIWLQGLLPSTIRGITIATDAGDVTVQGGSVSISVQDGTTNVWTWDRSATIEHNDQQIALVAGDHVELWKGGVPVVRRIPMSAYNEAWASQNLERDAVHQREVAQLQRERSAAAAGILPTSPLYSMKRFAESVDVFLTLDPEERVEKVLQQATTRLNEAVVLVSEGQSGAVVMEEYRSTLLSVAGGSGADSVTQFLVRKEIEENAANLAAALPEDDLYILKKAVLEASTELPQGVAPEENVVQGTLLLDSLATLQRHVREGDVVASETTYAALQTELPNVLSEDTDPLIRKQARALLEDIALMAQTQGDSLILIEGLEPYLPLEAPIVERPMTEGEIENLIDRMKRRIFIYSQPRSRWNQLQVELKRIKGHPDEGSILRYLYDALPENGLARPVRAAIQELREEKEGGSGLTEGL